MHQHGSVSRAKHDRIALVTLNRTGKRNAMDEQLLLDLLDALRDVERDRDVLAMVLTGSGSVFSSGADRSPTNGITDPVERNRVFAQYSDRLAGLMVDVFALLSDMRVLSVAAVNGHAVGGGFLVALGCDFRVASQDAKFWFPEIELGRAISKRTVDTLVHFVGPAVAREMVLTAKRYSAEEAKHLNLVNEVTPSENVMDAAVRWARALADGASIAEEAYTIAKARTNSGLRSIWNREAVTP